jgi:hypothetical protein
MQTGRRCVAILPSLMIRKNVNARVRGGARVVGRPVGGSVSWAGMPRCVGGDSDKIKHDTVSYSVCIVTGGDGRTCTGQTLGGSRVSVLMPEHGEARYGSLDRTMSRAFVSPDAVDIAICVGPSWRPDTICQIGAV